MSFQIIDNIEVPASTSTRTRERGPFAQALDALEVGQGFLFDSKGTLKSQYPKVSPSKFGGKKFKVWAAVDAEGNIIDGKFGVKRLSASEAAEHAAEDNSAADGE